jgi:sugar/nucleoside kinase (ribokinase family)
MRRAKAASLVTSLDVSYPDASSPAGQADWPVILERTLPHVDLYLPSLEETLFMLDRARHDAMLQQGPIIDQADGDLLIAFGERLLALGVAVAGLKLGDQGLYVRTSTDQARFASLAPLLGERLEDWVGRELLMPCFAVDVAGTTGAGDTTIAGFLTALLHGSTLADALTLATGAGACSVEQADASSGVPPWGDLLARIDAGWRVRNVELSLTGWHPATHRALWYGPNDHQNDSG